MRLFMALVLALTVGVVVHVNDRHEAKRELGRSEQQSLQERDKLVGRITELEADLSNERQVNDDIELHRIELERQLAEARRVRASRSRRATALPVLDWAHSQHGIQIANCESADLNNWPWSDGSRYLGGEKGVHLRDPNGHYGKWQFAPATWRSVGGTGNPADASEAEQDMRAERLHDEAEERHPGTGERPWSCSRMV